MHKSEIEKLKNVAPEQEQWVLPFIDKEKFFGKKRDIQPPGVAPKTSGTVKGKWVWYRERDEKKINDDIEQRNKIISERHKDYAEYQQAPESEKEQRLYLLKTGAINLEKSEWQAINNVRNRVEVANSALLNYFLGEGSAVKNTISYSTYHHEDKDENEKYYIDENGYVKEELASLYVGRFDTPRGIQTETYNKEQLQLTNFAPLRKAFVVCGLMGFHDFLANYDNFAFIQDKLVITDTGVGSGNTGDHAKYVPAGKTNFNNDVIMDLDLLFQVQRSKNLISTFKDHLIIDDIIKGIDDLKTKSKQELKKVLDAAFAPIPNPFKKLDPRYKAFTKYNDALQLHKERLLNAYAHRFDILMDFQEILANKFYPTKEYRHYHVPSLQKLKEVDEKLTAQNLGKDPELYKIYSSVNEQLFNLDKKDSLDSEEQRLHAILIAITKEYEEETIHKEKIVSLFKEGQPIQESIFKKAHQIQKNEENKQFEALVNDLKNSLPKSWKKFIDNNDPQIMKLMTDKKTDSKTEAMVHLNVVINNIRKNKDHINLQEAKKLLKEAIEIVIQNSEKKQSSGFLGNTHTVFGKSFQITTSRVATALEKFLASEHFTVDKPTITKS